MFVFFCVRVACCFELGEEWGEVELGFFAEQLAHECVVADEPIVLVFGKALFPCLDIVGELLEVKLCVAEHARFLGVVV